MQLFRPLDPSGTVELEQVLIVQFAHVALGLHGYDVKQLLPHVERALVDHRSADHKLVATPGADGERRSWGNTSKELFFLVFEFPGDLQHISPALLFGLAVFFPVNKQNLIIGNLNLHTFNSPLTSSQGFDQSTPNCGCLRS